MDNIFNIFPECIKGKLGNIGSNENITEIRLRVGRRIIIYISKKEITIDYIVTLKDILDILVKVSKNSLYSIQNDINEGFVTVRGGHRIGIAGEAVIENGKVVNIKNINSLNIRIARQVLGAANTIINYIADDFNLKNVLIVAPPGCGKTTILRDLIRQVSSGDKKRKGYNVGVVDSRGEIASVYGGIPYLDVGFRTDVITNISKSKGIEMLIRSMGLDSIATDEIGSKEDIIAIEQAMISGVKLMFTMHGSSIKDVYNNINIKKIVEYFDYIILLSNKNSVGTIEKIHSIKSKVDMEVI